MTATGAAAAVGSVHRMTSTSTAHGYSRRCYEWGPSRTGSSSSPRGALTWAFRFTGVDHPPVPRRNLSPFPGQEVAVTDLAEHGMARSWTDSANRATRRCMGRRGPAPCQRSDQRRRRNKPVAGCGRWSYTGGWSRPRLTWSTCTRSRRSDPVSLLLHRVNPIQLREAATRRTP
jgi:hypothetical protein